SAGCARAACPARHSASVAARLLIVEVEFMSGTYLSNPFRFVHLCVTISVSLIYEPDRSASSPRWLGLLVGLAEDRLGQFLGDGELAGAFRGTRPAAHQRDAQQVAGGLGARDQQLAARLDSEPRQVGEGDGILRQYPVDAERGADRHGRQR